MPSRILIIDDEPTITRAFSALLQDHGYETAAAGSVGEALVLVRRRRFDLTLLDLQLPDQSGVEFLRRTRELTPSMVTVVVSGQADIPKAVETIKLGAVDFLEKPVSPERLIATVRTALMLSAANRQREQLVTDLDAHNQIVGRSSAIRKLLEVIMQVAPADTAVLITGENGTGKELVASRLYLEGSRRDKPFIKVNCPGIPETLFESELFGHLKGAFTGAVRDYPGKFVQADGGTLFLDEIGDLPMASQAKLLRVLETGEVETLGATQTRVVDVRVICATNRPLEKLIAEGAFRQDLYYRISVFCIPVPSLAERRDDIPLLIGGFLARFDPAGSTRLAPEAVAYLTTLALPGNVRQLKNIIERLCILCRGRMVSIDDVVAQSGTRATTPVRTPEESSLGDRMALFERNMIQATLESVGGNISEAARLLKVDRAQLSRKVSEFGLKEA
ncbi:MAG: sigma-54 dependent transcriptional regulator [Candidatus Zixiibacteriota bacterium]